MSTEKLIISPKTKVGELLDAYPQLEDVLLELSPSFAKLKNPLLRRTVARVASLQHAAGVSNIPVDKLVNCLRKEVGQDLLSDIESSEYLTSTPAPWFNESLVSIRFDATPVIQSGISPMAEILTQANRLNTGDILELKTPFVPAPIIDILKERGYETFSKSTGEFVLSYFRKRN